MWLISPHAIGSKLLVDGTLSESNLRSLDLPVLYWRRALDILDILCVSNVIFVGHISIRKLNRTYKSYILFKIMDKIKIAIGLYLVLMVKELAAYGENGKSKRQEGRSGKVSRKFSFFRLRAGRLLFSSFSRIYFSFPFLCHFFNVFRSFHPLRLGCVPSNTHIQLG